ncbi:MAG: Lyzozyme M1 (1,4-beta-N-acetylmuramidase) [Lachnospiraceae bacterium]|nr:Lyzozyme M1 (1,4-beta-N-acetylmuramidase) [Lachnospiraceae bacterium]
MDINPYLARHGYDLSGLVYQKPFMQYYVNGTKKSFSGADISKEQGTVDFKRMKKAGVDYVMLRLGQRGYTTGEISLDDSFIVNYTAARDAGLDIGVYFVSSAISPEEAAEEADFCLETISVNEITLEYPIAISAEKLGDGRSRCDDLEKMPRTNCALAFMNRIEEKGYLSLLKADKATLITKYSLGSMIGYDIWYVGKEDIPDFPYPFVMWQYDDAGELSGVEGGVHLDMSFMDYSVR